MKLVEKGDSDGDFDNPHIEEDYYIGKLSRFNTYERDDEAHGLITFFEITRGDHEGTELPFFAPANLSVPREGSDANTSRLAGNLQNLDRLESVLEMLDCRDEVMTGGTKAIVEEGDEESMDDLQTALRGALSGHNIRFQVEDNRSGDASQVSKLQKIWDEDESEDDEGDE